MSAQKKKKKRYEEIKGASARNLERKKSTHARFTCTFTHTCYFYSGSTHPHTSTHFHLQIHLKLFYFYPEENSQKYFPIPVIPCEINARVILVTTTYYIISGDECSKKGKKEEKGYEEIKRGKCPEPRRKEKVRREVKMDKCPIVELGVQDTHLRQKKKRRASHSPPKFQKARKVCILSKSISRIRLSPLLSSPYTIHSPHMHILI